MSTIRFVPSNQWPEAHLLRKVRCLMVNPAPLIKIPTSPTMAFGPI
ncbi:hypothetical protein [Vibrio sagamiensis]|nr:hypothetical protein [Vibrio sagamiensis]